MDAEPSQEASGIKRAFARMAARDEIDVMWAPATRQLDREFLRVRVPLENGILGWRLFLVRQQDSEGFKSVSLLEELKARPAGRNGQRCHLRISLAAGPPRFCLPANKARPP